MLGGEVDNGPDEPIGVLLGGDKPPHHELIVFQPSDDPPGGTLPQAQPETVGDVIEGEGTPHPTLDGGETMGAPDQLRCRPNRPGRLPFRLRGDVEPLVTGDPYTSVGMRVGLRAADASHGGY